MCVCISVSVLRHVNLISQISEKIQSLRIWRFFPFLFTIYHVIFLIEYLMTSGPFPHTLSFLIHLNIYFSQLNCKRIIYSCQFLDRFDLDDHFSRNHFSSYFYFSFALSWFKQLSG